MVSTSNLSLAGTYTIFFRGMFSNGYRIDTADIKIKMYIDSINDDDS